jgi:hypothetical protein
MRAPESGTYPRAERRDRVPEMSGHRSADQAVHLTEA